jgi:hypothetical protein
MFSKPAIAFELRFSEPLVSSGLMRKVRVLPMIIENVGRLVAG